MPTLYEAVALCDLAATVAVPASIVKSTSPSRTLVKRWRIERILSWETWGLRTETRFRCEFWRKRARVSRVRDRNLVRRTRFQGQAEVLRGLFGELVVDVRTGARDERRLQALLDRLLRDHALGVVLARGQLEHDVEQRVLNDRTET